MKKSGWFQKFPLLVIMILYMPIYAADIIESLAPPSVIFEALALNKDLATLRKPKFRSPTDLQSSRDGKIIFICEQTAKRITLFDVTTGTILPGRILLPNEVTGCVVSLDGSILYATCASDYWPSGFVCVVDIASRRVTKRIGVGHYPRSPVLSPDGFTLYICNMFSNDVSVIDLLSQTEKRRYKVVREPYCADITPDGTTLVVGNSLPDDRSTDSQFVSCKISIIDLVTHTIDNVRLTRGSHSVFGLAVSPDGRYAFATHLIGKFNLNGTTVVGGWLHTNNLAVIDLQAKVFLNDACLDLSLIGMGNPWGIKCSKDGEYMVVTHAGANELSIIHYRSFIDTVLSRSKLDKDSGRDMQMDFRSLLNSRRRIQVTSKGPRALAMIGSSVYTTGYFDDETATLEEFEISLQTSRPTAMYSIGDKQPWNGEREGESNFYDAGLCHQKWQSCHSCHPFTRPDALNWILGGGAVFSPKNARSMLYAWWTPPTKWDGTRPHAQQSILSGIEFELFRVPSTAVSIPLDTFFMNLKPMMSPYLVKGRLSNKAQLGRATYYNKQKVDCSKCHPAPLFTDKIAWDAGTIDPYDANVNWDTPHLNEVWRTGPYGHLGNYWGLQEIIEVPGHSDAITKLDPTGTEMDELVEYVKSL